MDAWQVVQAVVVPLAGGAWWLLWQRIAEIKAGSALVWAAINDDRAKSHAWQLAAEGRFAKNDDLRRLEERIEARFDRLEEKLDRAIGRREEA